MKARAYILTIGTSLALLAPATQAAGAGNALGCNVPSNLVGPRTPSVSQGFRALQHVVIADDAASTQPVRTTCGRTKHKQHPAVPANYHQVLKNSF